jgi:hypothetical protein
MSGMRPAVLECVAAALGGSADLPELVLEYAGPSVYDLGRGPLQAYRNLVRTLGRAPSFGMHTDGEFHARWGPTGATFRLFDTVTSNARRGSEALLQVKQCRASKHHGVCQILRRRDGTPADMGLCKQVIAEEVVRTFVGPWAEHHEPEPSQLASIERKREFSTSVLACAGLYYYFGRTQENVVVSMLKTHLADYRSRFPTWATVLPWARPPRTRRSRKRTAKRRSPRLAKQARTGTSRTPRPMY